MPPSKRTTRKSFRILNCKPVRSSSPSRPLSKHTCYTPRQLLDLRDAWNANHSDDVIRASTPRCIWAALKKKLETKCIDEKCWIDHVIRGGTSASLRTMFAPDAPQSWRKNKTEWLSDADIRRVMVQYEAAYPEFKFIGPSPIDYDTRVNGTCVWPELCAFKLDLARQEGKTKIGVVFNLDPHTKGGSHWVALFIDLADKLVFYFDSNGDPAPTEIKRFMQTVLSQHPGMKIDQNAPTRHQKGGTECGVYVLFFLVSVLTGRMSPSDTKTKVFSDVYIQTFRGMFFNLPR